MGFILINIFMISKQIRAYSLIIELLVKLTKIVIIGLRYTLRYMDDYSYKIHELFI